MKRRRTSVVDCAARSGVARRPSNARLVWLRIVAKMRTTMRMRMTRMMTRKRVAHSSTQNNPSDRIRRLPSPHCGT